MATFFWIDRYSKGIHWKRRGILQRPHKMGGLGVRNSGILNTALLMKKVWRIKQNPQLLLSKVYNHSHLQHQSRILGNRQFSWGHMGLLQAEKHLQDHCLWKVGDGC